MKNFKPSMGFGFDRIRPYNYPPMKSPLFPFIGNNYMEYFEQTALSSA